MAVSGYQIRFHLGEPGWKAGGIGLGVGGVWLPNSLPAGQAKVESRRCWVGGWRCLVAKFASTWASQGGKQQRSSTDEKPQVFFAITCGDGSSQKAEGDGSSQKAERVRFELTMPLRTCRFSRPVQSATLPPLRALFISTVTADWDNCCQEMALPMVAPWERKSMS